MKIRSVKKLRILDSSGYDSKFGGIGFAVLSGVGRPGTPLNSPWRLDSSDLSWSSTLPIKEQDLSLKQNPCHFTAIY